MSILTMREATHHFARVEISAGGRMMGSGREGCCTRNTRGATGSQPVDGGLRGRRSTLFTNTEFVDDRAVPLLIRLLEIVEKTTAAADELQQSAPAVMILRVRFEVLGQVGDAIRQKRDLHFRRAGIAVMGAEVRNQFGFLLLRGWQNTVSLNSYGKN